MRPLGLILFFLALATPLRAEDGLAVPKVLSGDSFALEDGRTVTLAGLRAPEDGDVAEAARLRLEKLLEGRVFLAEPVALDRYGRVVARDRRGIGAVLVREGLAYLFPPLGTEPDLASLLKLEQEARRTRRGLWALPDYADLAPEEAGRRRERYTFVRGTVVDAARIKDKVYLNFGSDWRRDFTVTIAAKDLRFFRKVGLDPLTLKGKTLRVRGFVQSAFGPMIAVTHPAQVEVVP